MQYLVPRFWRPWLALLSVLSATLLIEGCDQSEGSAEMKKQGQSVPVQIGYMPVMADAQLFVALDNGDLADAGLEPRLISFQNGPAVVQALASGQLDIAYLGIGPVMVARSKGADIRVVASNINRQVSVVALGKLAPFFQQGDPATAFARFRAATGHKARISTFPRGSVPQTVFAYWLDHQLQADASDVEIIHQGASQVQQALLSGAVDGAATLEPTTSLVLDKAPQARVVASGSTLFPQHPGAVLVVRKAFIKAHPKAVRRLVAAHERATQALIGHKTQAIKAVGRHVGDGRLPPDIIAQAVARSQSHFDADPRHIMQATRHLLELQQAQGVISGDLDIKALFDDAFYRRAAAQ